jgi:hypothetical protein
MTWTYTGDPNDSARDAIRFLIGDTDSTDQLVTDEEIAWLNTEVSGSATSTTHLYRASARAANAIGAKFSRLADQQIGDLSVKMSQKATAAYALAASLNELAATDSSVPIPYAGGISVSDKKARDEDTDRVMPFFETAQFANTTDPGAGPARALT